MLFLSWPYLKSENWERFADIYDGLGTLIEQNYDSLSPEGDRAKQLAFKWLSENRFASLLEEKKPTEADYDHIARLLAGLTRIKPVLEKRFPDGSPFPSALFTSVQKWEKSCKPKPKVESAPAAGGQSESPAANSATRQTPPATNAAASAEPMETPQQAQAIIRKASLFLVEKESTKPAGYRLIRCLRWDILEKAPQAEGGKTQIAGPNAQQRSYFQKLVADKDWKNLLEKSEAAFAAGKNHLWLDLQRYSATACRELGAEYLQVRNAILFETALLLKRIPELTNLSFSDGSTFCDDATKDWIEREVKPVLGAEEGGEASSRSSSVGNEDPLIEERRNISQLLSVGKIQEAIEQMQAKVRSSSNERDNFRRTILISDLLLKAKQADIAVSVLEALDRKIEQHKLDRWDPEIAVEAWAALFCAYKAARTQKPQNIQAAIQEKQNEVLSKISQIDPGKAFTLTK